MMTSKEYEKLEKRYQELWIRKTKLEKELQEVTAEYLNVLNRLNYEPIVD